MVKKSGIIFYVDKDGHRRWKHRTKKGAIYGRSLRVPKGMMLIGHTQGYDIYESKSGIFYWYYGKSKEDFRNASNWTRIGKVV